MKLSGRITTVERTMLYCGPPVQGISDRFITAGRFGKGGILVLADANTNTHCLPVLAGSSPLIASAREVFVIPPGEASKILATAEDLWIRMLTAGVGRDALLVTVGGGVVSDLGGFVAAGYKRGIPCIHFPTSLVGQVDAAIGGKTGVNLGGFKNQVGFFYPPEAVFIFPGFLETLPAPEILSGMAEMVKTLLVGDPAAWNKLQRHHPGGDPQYLLPEKAMTGLISAAVKVKNKIVRHDFQEHNVRKVLNFGHTIGHALESCSHLPGREPLRHGEAVAAGMVCSCYLSVLKSGLPVPVSEAIVKFLTGMTGFVPLDESEYGDILNAIRQDKKNRDGRILFTLLSQPGVPRINVACDKHEITAALNFYRNRREAGT
jgi:3-dehydroquinate synthase